MSFEYDGTLEPAEFLLEKLSPVCKNVESIQAIGTFNHVFSHRIWEMESYSVKVTTDITLSDEAAENSGLWISSTSLHEYPLVAAHHKILSEYDKL